MSFIALSTDFLLLLIWLLRSFAMSSNIFICPSIADVFIAFDGVACMSSDVSECSLMPLVVPAWLTNVPSSLAAWSAMPFAWHTISDLPHTTFSCPSTPGSTAMLLMLAALCVMLPPADESPTPSIETLLALMVTLEPPPPSIRLPCWSTLPSMMFGAETITVPSWRT